MVTSRVKVIQSYVQSDLVNPNALVPKKSRYLSTDNVVCVGCKSGVINTQLRQV